MKKPEPPNSSSHPDDLLLPYVEGLLEPSDRRAVEEHLMACPACSSAVDELRETIALVKENRESLCPEPWELYEYVHYGHDPEDTISGHLAHCAACQEAARSPEIGTAADQMPWELQQQLKARIPAAARTIPTGEPIREGVLAGIYRWLRFPALAAGLAAAAVLAVVLLVPRGVPESRFAFSTVTWDGVPKPKTFQPKGKRVAMVILLKDLKEPLSQKKIDAMYQALAPTMELVEHLRFVPPDRVKESLSSTDQGTEMGPAFLKNLRDRLEVSAVLVISLSGAGEQLNVETTLFDAVSGKSEATRQDKRVSRAHLTEAMAESAHSVLRSFIAESHPSQSQDQ